MKIAIIGTGRVATVLGTRWAALGHQIRFGSRAPADDKARAAAEAAGANAAVASIAEAAQFGEVVVLATPFEATQSAIGDAGDLSGKIVVDCTNPFKPNLAGLSLGFEDSAGESVARWATGARVVKAFNTTGTGNMAEPQYGGGDLTMFICGDDDGAKEGVAELASGAGVRRRRCGSDGGLPIVGADGRALGQPRLQAGLWRGCRLPPVAALKRNSLTWHRPRPVDRNTRKQRSQISIRSAVG